MKLKFRQACDIANLLFLHQTKSMRSWWRMTGPARAVNVGVIYDAIRIQPFQRGTAREVREEHGLFTFSDSNGDVLYTIEQLVALRAMGRDVEARRLAQQPRGQVVPRDNGPAEEFVDLDSDVIQNAEGGQW